MKEWGEGVISKAEADYRKWKEYMIDKDGEYKCSVCKKVWIPCDIDINRKRPSTYYKLCSACRMKSFIKGREYKEKKGNNYNALNDINNRKDAKQFRYGQY
jgi:hypothetical protein